MKYLQEVLFCSWKAHIFAVKQHTVNQRLISSLIGFQQLVVQFKELLVWNVCFLRLDDFSVKPITNRNAVSHESDLVHLCLAYTTLIVQGLFSVPQILFKMFVL